MNNSRIRRRQQQPSFQKAGQLNKPINFQSFNHSQKIKSELIQRLNFLIDNITNTKKIEVCTQDSVIIGLQKIAQQAKIYDFKEIIKLANLAIGKRILNLQLERKRNQIQNKIQKKTQIESFFRQNRINKTNYEQIALLKLQENTLIVRPHNHGKAFIQSTFFYERIINSLTGKCYKIQLEQCNYLQTIKTVNKIFFSHISNIQQIESKKKAANNPILKIGAALLFVIAILCIAQGFLLNSIIIYLIFAINLLLLLLMSGLAFYSFFNVKGGKSQLEQSMLQIQKYFDHINQRNKKLGLNHQWKCPPHFLYLQVKFDSLE